MKDLLNGAVLGLIVVLGLFEHVGWIDAFLLGAFAALTTYRLIMIVENQITIMQTLVDIKKVM